MRVPQTMVRLNDKKKKVLYTHKKCVNVVIVHEKEQIQK